MVGWVVGWGGIEIKANSAQLKLELGLSLAIPEIVAYLSCSGFSIALLRMGPNL